MSSPHNRVQGASAVARTVQLPGNNKSPMPSGALLQPGTRVKAQYLASAVGPVKATKWFEGTISKINKNGNFDIEYDDGDEEDDVQPQFIQLLNEEAQGDEVEAEASPSEARARRASANVDYRKGDGSEDAMEVRRTTHRPTRHMPTLFCVCSQVH